MRFTVLFAAVCMVCLSASAQRVGLLGSGESSRDTAYRNMLIAQGLNVAWTVAYYEFNSAVSLSACDVVLLTPLINHYDMPVAGQWALESWVRAGGGLVTVEWTLWSRANARMFAGMSDLFPAQASQFYQQHNVVYTLNIHDPVLSAGLNPLVPLGFLKETRFQARSGATVFYASNYTSGSAGVVGWRVAEGRVMSLSIAAGATSTEELSNLTLARLLANAVRWAARNACTPRQGDANRDGCVDDADLLSVLFNFGASGATEADVNCDSLVDDADLLEVLFQFGAGC
ncbi:MAG: hypothetical protein N2651_08105 [Fimbriimonadales bacterium]|nr:hypothetical protein [Fimbriimonadales bacterium]